MGTIVSYDVLSDPRYHVSVDALVTIGSPLGLPPITRRLALSGRTACLTPEGIRGRWVNFADLQDQVAFNYDLADDFGPNLRGVRPQDVLVFNTWRGKGGRDPHNIFGYTRTPEVASTLAEMLAPRPGWLARLGSALRKLLG